MTSKHVAWLRELAEAWSGTEFAALYTGCADEIERLRRIESVVIELVRSAQDWGSQVGVSEQVFTDLEAALEVNGSPVETESKPPDCMGCHKPIESWHQVYRCTDCDMPYHKGCIGQHAKDWQFLHPLPNTLRRRRPCADSICYCHCDDGDPRACHGWQGQQDEPPCECICHDEASSQQETKPAETKADCPVDGLPLVCPTCGGSFSGRDERFCPRCHEREHAGSPLETKPAETEVSTEEAPLNITDINQWRKIWVAALTLANNICVQESDRVNDDDGPSEVIHATAECAKRIRGWLEPDDSQFVRLLREAGALPQVETSGKL
jgi:hypothetical protein